MYPDTCQAGVDDDDYYIPELGNVFRATMTENSRTSDPRLLLNRWRMASEVLLGTCTVPLKSKLPVASRVRRDAIRVARESSKRKMPGIN